MSRKLGLLGLGAALGLVAVLRPSRRARAPRRLTVLVTGASSGIGLELVRLFAADGHRLLLVARGAERLEQLRASLPDAAAFVCDLSLPGAAESLCVDLERGGEEVDVLVNNAGAGILGDFVDVEADRHAGLVQLNMGSLVVLTRLLLPGMLRRGYGRVLNVASTAGFQPGPTMAVYYASKAFVHSFSRALQHELRSAGDVACTSLCPGATVTEFGRLSGNGDSKLFAWGGAMSAKEVASAGYAAMWSGAAVCIPGAANKLVALLVPLLPDFVVVRASAFLLTPSS